MRDPANLAALLQQRLHNGDGRGLADVIGAPFESETEYAKPLAAQRPKRAVHLPQEAVALVFVLGSCCYSQTVNIWPGVAPGSEKWTQTETTAENTPMGKVVFSVVTPTLTLYLPEKSKATGTGIIVAPGGACVALAIDHEGEQIARRRGLQ